MKDGLPTGTLSLLFTDVEGSTRMAPDVDAHRYAEALKEHHRLIRDAVAAQGRRGAQGDAFYVFTSTREAVACAQDAQERLASSSERLAGVKAHPHVDRRRRARAVLVVLNGE